MTTESLLCALRAYDRSRRLIWAMLPTLMLPAVAFAAPPSHPYEVVRLPEFIVEDSRHPLQWRYASLPGMEVLSTCSARDTEDFIDAFYLLYETLHLMMPEELSYRTVVPRTILLLDEKDHSVTKEIALQAIRAEDTRVAKSRLSAPVLPKFGEAAPAADAKTPAPAEEPPVHELGFLPNMRLSDVDSYMTFMLLRSSALDPGALTLAREEVGYLLDHRSPPLPRWYIDGVQLLYRSAAHAWNGIRLPALKDWPALQTIAAQNALPSESPSLMHMFVVSDAERFDRQAVTERAIAAMLFVRTALRNDAARSGLARFVALAAERTPTKEDFQACFGRDVDTLLLPQLAEEAATRDVFLRLRRGPRPNWDGQSVHAELPPGVRLTMHAAQPFEVARIVGDWQRRAAVFLQATQPQIAQKYFEQADRLLSRAYLGGERDVRLLAVMGLLNCDRGADEAAMPFLEAAVAGNVARPRVYFELARIRFAKLTSSAAPNAGRLDPAQIESVCVPLRRGCELSPPNSAAYELLAQTWLRSATSPSSADVALLQQGVRLFPANFRLREAVLDLSRGAAR